MRKLLVIHGPNLNLLGKRKPEYYGKLSLSEINKKISDYAEFSGVKVAIIQSNSEAEIIDQVQRAEKRFDGIIINPAAYTHTSVAIRDTIEAINIPVVEVHLSNIYAREDFRQKTITTSPCIGQISGFGFFSYLLAIDYFIKKGENNEL